MEQSEGMGSSFEICEITESKDELDLVYHSKGLNPIKCKAKMDVRDGKRTHQDEHELSRLIETVDKRMSRIRVTQQSGRDLLRKHALKRPIRVGASQASGIGISESVTLKQALRRLCISQASETAAMKRLSKPIGLSGVSEAGTIKRLYAAVVVQADGSLDEDKGKLLEISLVSEKGAAEVPDSSTESSEVSSVNVSNNSTATSPHTAAGITRRVIKPKIQDVISSASPDFENKPEAVVGQIMKGKSKFHVSTSSCKPSGELSKPHIGSRLIKPIFVNKNITKKKLRHESAPISGSSTTYKEASKVGAAATKSTMGCQKECTLTLANYVDHNTTITSTRNAAKPESTPSSGNSDRVFGGKTSEGLKAREKGECSQSSKSSMGDYSSSTSISDESNQSTSSGHGSRPHMSKDFRWTAIHHVEMNHGHIGLNNFKLLRRLGCGDIGTVYLAELMGSNCLFALKVMDNEFLLSRKKMPRAQTEREILQILDHPFLPTLYTYFTTDNLSCLVMEYCPGGDLHVLRQRQPGRSFSEPAARFYVAEVLLALEYLHMLGVIYRDLKPENILVREDGHIMLSDFDLSLRCTVSPTLLSSSSPGAGELDESLSGPLTASRCIDPLCPPPSCVQVSCFTPRLMSSNAARTKNTQSDVAAQVTPLPQLVAEPTEARSNSFVGTHEYLAPEIIKGEGHGSSVDWWTFGIFLYELLFGRTPFKGSGNEETLTNIVTQNLKFPESQPVSFQAKDLIRGLLVKEPENRLGSLRGAAEIKQHPFFEGLNWALIRCAVPPETPCADEPMVAAAATAPAAAPAPAPAPPVNRKKIGKCLDFGCNGEKVEFELF